MIVNEYGSLPDAAQLDLLRGWVQGGHVLLHVPRHESPQQAGLPRVVQAQEQQLARLAPQPQILESSVNPVPEEC